MTDRWSLSDIPIYGAEGQDEMDAVMTALEKWEREDQAPGDRRPDAWQDVGELEEALLALHIAEFQRRPFANSKGGRRMSPPKARSLLAAAFAD